MGRHGETVALRSIDCSAPFVDVDVIVRVLAWRWLRIGRGFLVRGGSIAGAIDATALSRARLGRPLRTSSQATRDEGILRREDG